MRRLAALIALVPALAFGQGLPIKSGSTTDLADVDPTLKALKVITPTTPLAAGYSKLAGDKYAVEVPSVGRLMVGQDAIQFYDGFEGATINGGLWTTPVTTFTMAQANGFLVMNSGAVTTANAVARLNSVPQFRFLGRLPLMISFRIKIENICLTNTTAEWGWGTATGTTAPTDGVYFRCNPNGEFRAYLNYNGVETPSPVIVTPTNGNTHTFRIVIFHDDAHFYVDNVEVADLDVPVDGPAPAALDHQPVFVRLYNGAATPALAPRLSVSQIVVAQYGMQQAEMAVANGLQQKGAAAHPQTYAQTASINHSTTNMTMTANTAPATANLGGDFIFAALAGGTSEYPIFAYTVPAGFRYVITGIHITSASYGAATATTPTIFQWYLGTGDTATSLATADSADFTALAVRRTPLCTQIFPVNTQIGWAAGPDDIAFKTPVVVESGRVLHIILAVPVGTATASQIFRGTVFINGYYE